jgi:hypothetical protein
MLEILGSGNMIGAAGSHCCSQLTFAQAANTALRSGLTSPTFWGSLEAAVDAGRHAYRTHSLFSLPRISLIAKKTREKHMFSRISSVGRRL